MYMILLIMQMKISSKKRKELSQTIASLTGSIVKTEKGCRRCDFFYSLEDANTLCLIEEWSSREDLEMHLNSECFRVLRGAMNLLEEPCKISSFRSFPETGMERPLETKGGDSSIISQIQ
jgi:quinol monooxygenase YgiN